MIGASVGMSQARDTSPPSPQFRQTTPVPLVSAGASVSAHAVDWSHYEMVEDCVMAFQRVVLAELGRTARDTLRDTTYNHRRAWTPLPPAALEAGRQCLSHFQGAGTEVPLLALPQALRLAVGLNADTLVPVIVARQLAQSRLASTRVAVLRAAIDVVMKNHWDGVQSPWSLTPAHVQLAHTLLGQLDALGVVALKDRVALREETLLGPALDAQDVDAQLALARGVDSVFQQVPLASLPPGDRELQSWYLIHAAANRDNMAALTYVQTPGHTQLAAYLATHKELVQVMSPGVPITEHTFDFIMEGRQAPAVTGDYWFNTPHGGSLPVPIPGQINVLWMPNSGGGEGSDALSGGPGTNWTKIPRALRRIHQEFPDVKILVITHTNGTYLQHLYVEHPEQEAALIGHYFTDSLKVPGVVGVLKSSYQTLGGGHVLPLPLPVWEAYHGGGLYVIDRTGMIVSRGDEPYGQDLVEFVRHLRAKGPPATSP